MLDGARRSRRLLLERVGVCRRLVHSSMTRIHKMRKKSAINQLVEVMAKLRAPDGCPWDREQTHQSIRMHAIEEVYELVDAIEASDETEMVEELGDVLLQVVFHCQLGRERGAFDLEQVARHITDKLIRRHPHVFGNVKLKSVDAVWDQWERIKRAEKHGTRYERPSVFDGIPKRLPALMRVEELTKKARKAGLNIPRPDPGVPSRKLSKKAVAQQLFRLAQYSKEQGWSAEALLRSEAKKRERALRVAERRKQA